MRSDRFLSTIRVALPAPRVSKEMWNGSFAHRFEARLLGRGRGPALSRGSF
jgi:hypothetical protein